MAIVGHHPETGVRVVVERPRAEGPPWRYEGEAVTQSDRFALTATVDLEGHVVVELPADAPADLAAKLRLIIRAAYRHMHDGGADPPRRIARWRADR
jgi:hypothetical protein